MGCTRDVHKTLSHETEMVNFQDRDVEPSRPRRDRNVPFSQTFKTEMRRDVQPSRPRRSRKCIETAVSQFKNTNWWRLSLEACFLQVRSIIFYMIYQQAWCFAWMFTRPKATKPCDWDIISSRPRRSKKRLETASRPRCSRPRLHPWVALLLSVVAAV